MDRLLMKPHEDFILWKFDPFRYQVMHKDLNFVSIVLYIYIKVCGKHACTSKPGPYPSPSPLSLQQNPYTLPPSTPNKMADTDAVMVYCNMIFIGSCSIY